MVGGANLDDDDVAPILSRTGLFETIEVSRLDRWVRRTRWPFTRKKFVIVKLNGETHRIRITCEKDDIGESNISFRGADAVVSIVQEAIRAHMVEQGRLTSSRPTENRKG